MKYEISLKNGFAALCLATCSMAAQATLLDIDQLSGYIFVDSLNRNVSAVDTQINSRNHYVGGPSIFSAEPGYSALSSTFNTMLTSLGEHYTGGSFGWTVFNRGPAVLKGIRFSLFLDAALSDGSHTIATTGGGRAGDYSEFGTFDNGFLDIPSRLNMRETPSKYETLKPAVTSDKDGSMLYALGLDIGSLQINQGFEITYKFGNTGMFGKNGDNQFYLDVDAPRFIPEPASLAMIGLGLMGLMTTRRYKRNTARPAKPV